MQLFSKLFSSKPLSIFMKCFASIEDSLRFSALCNLPEILFSIFRFLRGLLLSKTVSPIFRVTSDFFSPVGLMRVFSIIAQKTYGFFGTVQFLSKQFSFGKMVPSSHLKKFFARKTTFCEFNKSPFRFFGTMRFFPERTKSDNVFLLIPVGEKWFSSPIFSSSENYSFVCSENMSYGIYNIIDINPTFIEY